jgi:hypothetical protein
MSGGSILDKSNSIFSTEQEIIVDKVEHGLTKLERYVLVVYENRS